MSVQGGSAFHVTASGPVASGGGGTLHTVCVNTGASGGALALYDGTSTSGPQIAVIAATSPICLTYDAALNAGLYAAVSGAIDVTVTILPPGRFNT